MSVQTIVLKNPSPDQLRAITGLEIEEKDGSWNILLKPPKAVSVNLEKKYTEIDLPDDEITKKILVHRSALEVVTTSNTYYLDFDGVFLVMLYAGYPQIIYLKPEEENNNGGNQ